MLLTIAMQRAAFLNTVGQCMLQLRTFYSFIHSFVYYVLQSNWIRIQSRIKNDWTNECMNEWKFLFPCDQKLAKSHPCQLKEDNGKLKQNAEQYGVCEGSQVEVQWVVRWLAEDLWWERFAEHVCFKSWMEDTRVMDGVMVVTSDERFVVSQKTPSLTLKKNISNL